MRNVTIAAILGACTLIGSEISFGQSTPTAAACPRGTTSFHGHCVEENECCIPDVCPDGQVFEFQDTPKCVPCADALSQSAMNVCAGRAARVAETNRKTLYDQLIKEFPDDRRRFKQMEQSWQAFRDKWCDLEAGPYEGGTMQPLVAGSCLQAVTNRHISELQDLRRNWQNH